VVNRFNDAKPPTFTAAVTIDISKAFDGVNHTFLLEQFANSQLHSNVVRWMVCYIQGCSASCLFRGAKSRSQKIHSGVPQGSVLSPSIFNFFVSTCCEPASLLQSYADDFTIAESSADGESLGVSLTVGLSQISAWAKEKDLVIPPGKSKVIFFTPDRHQSHFHPQVTLEGGVIPLDRNIKILGVTFDPHFIFNAHVGEAVTKGNKRNQVVKALSGTYWGQDKETLITTYKCLTRPVLEFGAPIWRPNVSETSLKRLPIV
jgi:hypothetical protein